MKESSFYTKLYEDDSSAKKTVRCNLCGRMCRIADGGLGFCNTQKNIDGKLYSLNYHRIASCHTDPIEKKPLYHFLPGSSTYSIGGFGCNFSCLNCQNYMLSMNSFNEFNSTKILPETIVKNAINDNCLSISWTYNEPTLYFDFARETSLISHKENLKNAFVSNGYMSEESLRETLNFIDAFNIDLKFFDDKLYREICGGKLDIVLDNLKAIHQSKSHLEITTLLINDLNTDEDHIRSICNFVLDELGQEVPIHFSRFFPMHKMSDRSPTNIEYLLRAKEIAIDMGIEYVYLGNMPADNNSYCPNCGELLIARERYCNRDKNRIENGRCANCGHKLNFVLK
ncbi:AmmeMemoRadiSam system radical SAM enzyme [Methanobrevibacter ruminantium]|uniref:AmmeMemoRadiSam system radical SAM enzyme n=1 Tax=Methanobrevibacter ruminantium TaxID=83816 RepID=UPI0026EB3188|nr:AmmeMemoRadiSam system radical SAM enzyme [Methanobrevibacter ruminantium]